MVNDLKQGIYLEEINTWLPWGTPKDELRKIANPVLQKRRDGVQLYWNDHIIFGGIRSQIQTLFYRNRADLADDPNANGNLQYVSLGFYNIGELDPREQHTQLKMRFAQALGTPSFDRSGKVSLSDLPFTEWNLTDALVVLMVFERFGEYCIGEIWHKPLPVWRQSPSYPKSA